MTRRFAWILNLDAELELARARSGYVAPRKLLAQLAEHGKSSRELLGPGDVLLDETLLSPAEQPPTGLIGRAWCPTPLAVAALRAFGVEPEPHPDAALLRRVNHRLFAHELGGGLPGQAYVRSREQLLAHVGNFEQRFLLKRPLSFAGRGQLRILGPLSEKQWSWVDVSLGRDGLLLEPLVEITLELSLHGFIWRDGRFELGHICRQLVGARGAFQGVRRAHDSELEAGERSAFLEQSERVADALLRAGYFGPFGIDAYRYLLDGRARFCALGELNARYTLGFVTGFPRHPSELWLD
jgi:hypothetical protein